MERTLSKLVLRFGTALTALCLAQAQQPTRPSAPLSIAEQGSFAVGGKAVSAPGIFDPKKPTAAGQTLHGDHAYVFYQIPTDRRRLPLVFLHVTGQFSKT